MAPQKKHAEPSIRKIQKFAIITNDCDLITSKTGVYYLNNGTIMNLDDLRVFLAVAQNNGFSRASERLNMPKASVSRAVARLEAHLGNRLFERSTRRLRLTEAGQLLEQQTGSLAERLEELLQHAAAQNDTPQGVLRIAAPYELGVFRLGNILNQMLLRYPSLEAEVDLTSNQIDPRSQEYDIVFRVLSGTLPDSNQVARRIYSIACGLYAAPSLLQRLGTPSTPSDLTGWPGVLNPADPVWQLQGEDGGIEEIRPFSRLRAHNVGMRLQGVIDGLGVGVLATHYCQRALASGKIVQLLPDFRITPTRVYALLPGRRLMPAKVRLFLDALSDALAPWDQEGNSLSPSEALAHHPDSMEE
jgi:DNA-binding transcriptional LysR family regulator